MFLIGAYSAAIGYLEIEYLHLPDDSHVKNISMMHSLLGFVISLLLAYRTNTAYDRWWEGRKMWGGLVNNRRNLAIKLSAILQDEKDKVFFRKIIPGYASILQKHLNDEETAQQLFDDVDLEIDHHRHRPNQIAQMLFKKINDLYISKKITGDQLIILNNEIQSFTDICGACGTHQKHAYPLFLQCIYKKNSFLSMYLLCLLAMFLA